MQRVAIRRGRDAEGAALGDRFAQEIDQGVVDARVLDASGREKKPHRCSYALGVGVVLLAARSGRISMETDIAAKTHRRPEHRQGAAPIPEHDRKRVMTEILLFRHAQGQTRGFLAFPDELPSAATVVPDTEL